MDTGSRYFIYLVIAALAATFFIAVYILILFKKSKNSKALDTDQEAIEWGSISVLFDKNLNVTIIPYVKDKYGVGRAVDNVFFLQSPYKPERLGEIIREAMKICENCSPCTHAQLLARLQSKGWKEFSQGKRNLSIHYKQEKGIVFRSTIRNAEGAYQFNVGKCTTILQSNTNNKDLGQTALDLLKFCK